MVEDADSEYQYEEVPVDEDFIVPGVRYAIHLLQDLSDFGRLYKKGFHHMKLDY